MRRSGASMPRGSAGERAARASPRPPAQATSGVPGSRAQVLSGVSGTGWLLLIAGTRFEVASADLELGRRRREGADEQGSSASSGAERASAARASGKPAWSSIRAAGRAAACKRGDRPPRRRTPGGKPGSIAGRDETQTSRTKPLELRRSRPPPLERRDAVAETRGVLVAQALGEVAELRRRRSGPPEESRPARR